MDGPWFKNKHRIPDFDLLHRCNFTRAANRASTFPPSASNELCWEEEILSRQRKLIAKPILGSDHCSFGGIWKCMKGLCCSPSLAPHPGTLQPCSFHFDFFLIFIFAPYSGTLRSWSTTELFTETEKLSHLFLPMTCEYFSTLEFWATLANGLHHLKYFGSILDWPAWVRFALLSPIHPSGVLRVQDCFYQYSCVQNTDFGLNKYLVSMSNHQCAITWEKSWTLFCGLDYIAGAVQ